MNTKHKEKALLVNVRVSDKELKLLTAQAKRFTDGNLSLWLRVAGANYRLPTEPIKHPNRKY